MKLKHSIQIGFFLFIIVASPVAAQECRWAEYMEAAKKAHHRGRYVESERLFNLTLDEANRCKIADQRLVQSFNNMGLLFLDQARYADAEMLFKAATRTSERIEGRRTVNTACCLNNLATLYSDLAKYEIAEGLYKESLAVMEEAMDPQGLSATLNNLAQLYQLQGKWRDAEAFYVRTTLTMEVAVGVRNPQTATAWNNLGSLYRDRGRFAEATVLFDRALIVMRKAHGEKDPGVAGVLINLAKTYISQADPDKAAPLCQQALNICEEAWERSPSPWKVSFLLLRVCHKSRDRYDHSFTVGHIISAYEKGIEELQIAVAGMTDDQLRLRPVPGKWSTLEVVCHI